MFGTSSAQLEPHPLCHIKLIYFYMTLIHDIFVTVKMNFVEFVERVFCFMVLGFTIYYTRSESKKVNELKENALMAIEDYRIPIFIEDNGVILALGENPVLKLTQEYQDRCHIEDLQKDDNISQWLWAWIQYIE